MKRIEQRTFKKLSGLDLATKRDGPLQAMKRNQKTGGEAVNREPGTGLYYMLVEAVADQ